MAVSTYGDNDPGLQILAVLKRRKWIVAVTTLVFVALAGLLALLPNREYRSSAAILIASPSGADQVLTVQEADRAVLNERDFLQSDAVVEATRDRLGFEARVDAIQVSGTDILEVVATARDASSAALIANTYANAYLELRRADLVTGLNNQAQAAASRIEEIDVQLASVAPGAAGFAEQSNLLERRSDLQATEDQLRSQADVTGKAGAGRIIRSATPPAEPLDSGLFRYLLVGLFAGFVVGAALALARDALDGAIRSSDKHVGELRVLAVVPQPARRAASGGRTANGASRVEESYSLLRMTLDAGDSSLGTRVIQLAAPGRTVLTAEAVCGLGQAYRAARQRVLLVSADMGRPHLHELCGIPQSPGLGSCVTSNSGSKMEPFRVSADDGLMAVPADPDGLLNGQVAPADLASAFTTFRALAEIVIVESGPLRLTESLEMSRIADATVIVAQEGATQVSDIARAAERLRFVGAECAGIVLFSAGWSRVRRRVVVSSQRPAEPARSAESLLSVGH